MKQKKPCPPPEPPRYREESEVAEAIHCLVSQIAEAQATFKEEAGWWRSRHGLVTTKDLQELGKKIMSVISEFSTKQKAYNDRISNAIDGISTDIESLNAKITELQNSPGAITPEDQALLDEAQAQGEAVASKIEALDGMNPPNPPS